MESLQRNHYRDMAEDAVRGMMSAQADTKTMKKYMKELHGLAGMKATLDAAAFKAVTKKKGGI